VLQPINTTTPTPPHITAQHSTSDSLPSIDDALLFHFSVKKERKKEKKTAKEKIALYTSLKISRAASTYKPACSPLPPPGPIILYHTTPHHHILPHFFSIF